MDKLNQIRRDNLYRLKRERRITNTEIAQALNRSKSLVTWLLKPIGDKYFRPLNNDHIKKLVARYGKEFNFDASYFDKGAEKIFGGQLAEIAELKEILNENKKLRAANKILKKEYRELIDFFYENQRKTDNDGRNGGHKRDRKLPRSLTIDPPPSE